MKNITPFLWFDNQAEEAVNFYVSVFENSRVLGTVRYNKAGSKAAHMPEGSVMTVPFQLEGQVFTALNGGPVFKFNPSVSFTVYCETENKIDNLWKKLSQNGTVLMELGKYSWSNKYGWLSDQLGVSWQLILPDGKAEQKIVPSLMFVGDICGRAEEAINFYTSIFKNSGIKNIFRYGPDQKPDREGTVMYGDFRLNGQLFICMDSAHEHAFSFNEAISFVINCDTQEEVDHYWNNLSAHPGSEQCGWLKDKFGLSWQIVPVQLGRLLESPDKEKSQRVMKTMLGMKKLDIDALMNA
jgi:predicted 3-demethylubiquinone-9 3-methyltransferase (glyoxalase superfamily)